MGRRNRIGRSPAYRDGGESVGPGQDRSGIHCLCQGVPGPRSTWRRPATGNTPHMAGELFKMITGVNMVHVDRSHQSRQAKSRRRRGNRARIRRRHQRHARDWCSCPAISSLRLTKLFGRGAKAFAAATPNCCCRHQRRTGWMPSPRNAAPPFPSHRSRRDRRQTDRRSGWLLTIFITTSFKKGNTEVYLMSHYHRGPSPSFRDGGAEPEGGCGKHRRADQG